MQSVQQRLHLIWADKIVLWLVFLGIAALVICWCLVAVAAGVEGANHVALRLGWDPDIAIALLALWGVLRALDFVARGATHKLFIPTCEPQAPAMTVHDQPASTGKPMAAA
ncbi:MAG: hypothetical protein JSR55_11375 [Proteobacteria bacterium]|nr:hypothetical protein [Pseudomonadota bacterium]